MTSVPWPGRPLLFTVVGGILALAIYYLINPIDPDSSGFYLRVCLCAAIAAFGLAFFVVVRRGHLVSGIAFSLAIAAVVGGITYWRLPIDWLHLMNFAALAVALFVISPFYQTSLHSKSTSYQALHHHAWSNVVVVPLGLLFVGLAFGVAYMIAELFSLVGINTLKKLLRQGITPWFLGGVAMGASLGVLREHDNIIASTQKLVLSVFSLLTAPLALALGGFLLILPFTGLESLWSSTRNTSAILFICAFAALVFLNSAVSDDADSQSQNRFMQWAARLLAVCLAPLAVISALAIKLRVDQYGWTPDRLWATVICFVLVLYGVFYFVAALRKVRFNETIRQANVLLALLVSVVAFLLATPWLDFGAYSAKDQMARLKDGRVTEETLDLTAMAYDFGPAGLQALKDLRGSGTEDFLGKIDGVLSAESRWEAINISEGAGIDLSDVVKVLSGPPDIPEALLDTLHSNQVCSNDYCYMLWTEDQQKVFLVDQSCRGTLACGPEVQLYRVDGPYWTRVYDYSAPDPIFDLLNVSEYPDSSGSLNSKLDAAAQAGKIKIQPVQRIQIFIDGQAIGPSTD